MTVSEAATTTQAIPALARRTLLPVVVLLGALALLLGLAGCGPAAGTGSKADGPRLKFQEREHDFGKISNSQPTEYSFVFTNTGTQPLQIGEVEPEPPRAGT